MRNGLLAVAIGVVVAACGAMGDGEWAGSVEEREGVVRVSNPAAAPGGQDASPPFTLQQEQRFGAEMAPEEALLSFISGVAVDDAGTVYIVDRGNDRLVAFDPDGSVVWSAGRPGQGPGEFEVAGSIAWDGGDLLYVDNRSGGQIDTWTTSGEHVESRNLADFDISQGFVAGMPDSDTLVLWAWSRTHGDGANIHVFDLADGWTRTAEFFALGGREADTEEPAFWGHASVSVAGDRLWVGNRIEYEVREYALSGELLRIVAREHSSLIPPFVYKGSGISLGEFGAPIWLSEQRGLLPRYWAVGVEDAEDVKRQWDEYLASADPDDGIRYDSAIDLIDGGGWVLGSVHVGGPFHESIGDPQLVGPAGRLYTVVHEPYPHVRRYRVELD